MITLGKITAGTIRNVIAGHARIEGTIRGLTQDMILLIDKRLQEVCNGIEASFGVKVTLGLNQGGYWPVENNPKLSKTLYSICQIQRMSTLLKRSPQ